jgi:hypothetical protein
MISETLQAVIAVYQTALTVSIWAVLATAVALTWFTALRSRS